MNLLRLFTLIIFSLFLGLQSNADVILTSNFDGNDATTDPSTVTGVTWSVSTGTSMEDSGNLAALNSFNFGVLGGVSTVNNVTVNSNLNTLRPTTRGFSFAFTTTSDYELTNLNILSKHLNGSGTAQAFVSDLVWSINGVASGEVAGVTYLNTSGGVYTSNDIDLSGTTLTAGTYTVEIGMNDMVGGGAFASFDGVTLEGNLSAVPEPSHLMLFGALGLLTLNRRRQNR